MDLRVSVEPIGLDLLSEGLEGFTMYNRKPTSKHIHVVRQSKWLYPDALANIPYDEMPLPEEVFIHARIWHEKNGGGDKWYISALSEEKRTDPPRFPQLFHDENLGLIWEDWPVDEEIFRNYIVPRDKVKAYVWSISEYPGFPTPDAVYFVIPDELLV